MNIKWAEVYFKKYVPTSPSNSGAFYLGSLNYSCKNILLFLPIEYSFFTF